MTAPAPDSGRALLGLTALLLVAGAAIPSPAGGLASAVCAGLCALGALALGRGWTRAGAGAALLLALLSAKAAWPAFRQEQRARAPRPMSTAR